MVINRLTSGLYCPLAYRTFCFFFPIRGVYRFYWTLTGWVKNVIFERTAIVAAESVVVAVVVGAQQYKSLHTSHFMEQVRNKKREQRGPVYMIWTQLTMATIPFLAPPSPHLLNAKDLFYCLQYFFANLLTLLWSLTTDWARVNSFFTDPISVENEPSCVLPLPSCLCHSLPLLFTAVRGR